MTEADRGEAAQFWSDYELSFPILAKAGAALESWGVSFIWGNATYFVGPDGSVIAQGSFEVMAALREWSAAQSAAGSTSSQDARSGAR